jgi:hypothetical protein
MMKRNPLPTARPAYRLGFGEYQPLQASGLARDSRADFGIRFVLPSLAHSLAHSVGNIGPSNFGIGGSSWRPKMAAAAWSVASY